VANDTTVGRPFASAASSETACIGQAGWRVQTSARAVALVATGERPERAVLPTGAGCWPPTRTLAWPAARWLATSTSATPSQVPAEGSRTWAR
jgi:hypothetical protein